MGGAERFTGFSIVGSGRREQLPSGKTRLFVDTIKSVGIVDRGANPAATIELFKRDGESSGDKFAVDVSFAKVDQSLRIVGGWASIAKNADGTLPPDSQGDVIDTPEAIAAWKKALVSYAKDARGGDLQHEFFNVASLVEFQIIDENSAPILAKAMGGTLPEGNQFTGAWVGYYLPETDLGQRAWNGVLNAIGKAATCTECGAKMPSGSKGDLCPKCAKLAKSDRGGMFAALKRLLKLAPPELLEKAGIEPATQRPTIIRKAKHPELFKSFTSLLKDAGIEIDEGTLDALLGREPDDFNAELMERRLYEIREDLWECCSALMDALVENMRAGSDQARIDECIAQFATAVRSDLSGWMVEKSELSESVLGEQRRQRLAKLNAHKSAAIAATMTKKTEEPMPEPANKETEVTVESMTKGLDKETAEFITKRCAEEPALEAVLKGATPEMRAYLIKQEREKADLRKQAADNAERTQQEIRKREIADFAKRASDPNEFGMLQGTPEEKAELLYKMSRGEPLAKEDWVKVETMLKAASTQLAEGRPITRASGASDFGAVGTYTAELNKKVAEYRAQNPSVSEAVALKRVMDANGELAKRAQAESH